MSGEKKQKKKTTPSIALAVIFKPITAKYAAIFNIWNEVITQKNDLRDLLYVTYQLV